ncbi:GATOR1 complex protein NPRL3-like isoform X2 [Watersipora subatra]|uniref:GATOR1 complex protein NPRL3-like isoform X2 n=1 Tax=Watersipora subatra TaxID=2589382 RepID=UPI00355C1623
MAKKSCPQLPDAFCYNESQVLAVILSVSGSKISSLLFRYPCDSSETQLENGAIAGIPSQNKFAVKNAERFYEITNQYSDKVLSNFLAVQSTQLANKPFDVKVDDVQFVGYPVSVKHCPSRKKGRDSGGVSLTNVNVVFALPESVSESTKSCYHQLSQQVAMAIKHEEGRCCYFCSERKLMERVIEEYAPPEHNDIMPRLSSNTEESMSHPSQVMLDRGLALPNTLKRVFDSVSEKGIVLELMNHWTEINFCLPIKAHNLPFESQLCITEEDIDRCLELLRPYHAMLLLVESRSLLKSLPIDSSPALVRLLKVNSAGKNLQELAADCDLELSQVFKLVSHLVYWAKVTVIYPLCEPNVYVLSPNAPTSLKSHLVEDFEISFPDQSQTLTEVLSEFSLPLQLDEHTSIIDDPKEKSLKVSMVLWLLRRRLLIQLHTYLYLKPSYCHMDLLDSGQGPQLNDAGREKLASIADTKGEAIFAKLLPYFDGTRHIEDIMYYENMSRSEVFAHVDRFLPMLYTMQAADPATSYYAKVQ